jgi:hypothetical protein
MAPERLQSPSSRPGLTTFSSTNAGVESPVRHEIVCPTGNLEVLDLQNEDPAEMLMRLCRAHSAIASGDPGVASSHDEIVCSSPGGDALLRTCAMDADSLVPVLFRACPAAL